MVLPMHRMCAWLHVGKVFAHKSILPYILYSQGQSRNKPWKGQYPIDRLRSLFHIGTQIIPCLWHLGFIQIDFVWDVLVFHSHYLQIKINVVYVSLIRSVTSAPSFDAIVWLITLYSPPRNTGKLHWFLFWARDFENKKRPWQNIAICQGRITYKYKEYDTIRGDTLIQMMLAHVFSDMSMVDKLRKYFFISEIRKNFFELDLFLNILLHIQHVHYKNLLILNINYPLLF